MTIFETMCIDWEDDLMVAKSTDMIAAARDHVAVDWVEVGSTDVEAVTVMVREPGEPWGLVMVVGNDESATAAPAPAYVVRGLEATGQLDDAKRAAGD